MRIYGYQENSEELREVKEVSLQCSIEELDKVIKFLDDVRVEHAAVSQKTVICHSHFRDWDTAWTKEEPDIVIVTKFIE